MRRMLYYNKIFAILSLLIIMICVYVGLTIPINGKTVIDIYKSYPNRLYPATYTSFIWIPINILLVAFVLYVVGPFRGKGRILQHSLQRITYIFFAVALLNIIWTLSFYYSYLALSVLIMLVLLICLLMIIRIISMEDLNRHEKLLVKLPFSILFGWCFLKTMLSFAILLVSIGWDTTKQYSEVISTIALLLCSFLCIIIMLHYKNGGIGLAVIWGYVGSLVRHLSKDGYQGKYIVFIVAFIFSILIVIAMESYLLFDSKRK